MSATHVARPLFTLMALLALLIGPAPLAMAQVTSNDNWNRVREFEPPGTNGTVLGVAAETNGDLYVGGTFSKAGSDSTNFLAQFSASTGSWTSIADDIDGQVEVIRLAPDGNLYIGGAFTTADGLTVNGIARYTGSNWEALGPGVGGTVYDIDFRGNEVYAVGDFGSNVAVYNTITETWSQLGDGTDGIAYAVAVSGSEIYVGGEFASAGGTAVNGIAFWSVNSQTWNALANPTTNVNGLPGGTVFALDADGADIYVGGDFRLAIEPATSTEANNVAVWSDGTWRRLGTAVAEGVNNTIYSIAVSPDHIYVGGDFTQAGAVTVDRIAAWDLTAETWESLNAAESPVITGAQGRVNTLMYEASTSRLYVGGQFISVGGNLNVRRVAAWDLANNGWRGFGLGVDGDIFAMHRVNATNTAIPAYLYVGGNFSMAGGVPANNIARLNLSTYRWEALNEGEFNGTDGPVYAITSTSVAATGAQEIFVGGDFTDVASTTGLNTVANNIARWVPGTGWNDLGNTAVGTDGAVYAATVQNGAAAVGAANLLTIGGDFDNASGVARNSLAAIDAGDTSADFDEIDAQLAGADIVYAFALANNGAALIVGGAISSYDGGTATGNIVIVNDPAGTPAYVQVDGNDTNPGDGVNGTVFALTVDNPGAALGANNLLWIGGNFTSTIIGGVTTAGSNDFLVGFEAGTPAFVDPVATGITAVNGIVYGLSYNGTEDELYVSGAFTAVDGETANGVAYAEFSDDAGTLDTWNTMGTGLNPAPSGAFPVASAILNNGTDTFVGGGFTSAGGVPSLSLGLWTRPGTEIATGGSAPTLPPEVIGWPITGAAPPDIERLDRAQDINAATPLRVTFTWRAVEGASAYKLWFELQAAQDNLDITAPPQYFGPDTTYTIEVTGAGGAFDIEWTVCGTIASSTGAHDGATASAIGTADGPCVVSNYGATSATSNSMTGARADIVNDANDGDADAVGAADYTVYANTADLDSEQLAPVSRASATAVVNADVVATGISATVIVPASVAPRLFTNATTSEALTFGDGVVSVFVDPGSGALRGAGYAHWQLNGNNMTLTIYGDNPQTSYKDGFEPGENLRFLILNDGADAANFATTAFVVQPTFVDREGNPIEATFQDNAVYRATSFDAYLVNFQGAEQLVALEAGWNLFSTFVYANGVSTNTIEDVFRASATDTDLGFLSGGLNRFALARTSTGGIFYPQFGLDGIGAFDQNQGFQVFMAEADTIRIRGGYLLADGDNTDDPDDRQVDIPQNQWTL
ncbi:MAG: hypothetical protein AAF970_18220, partial [Bacteroidota bacterium]